MEGRGRGCERRSGGGDVGVVWELAEADEYLESVS